MLGGGGVDGAISSAGGDALYQFRKQIPLLPDDNYKRCEVGDARLTLSGKGSDGNSLKCDYVIHAVGPNYGWSNARNSIIQNDRLLYSAYAQSMKLAKSKGIKSIAFCLISASIFRGAQSLENVLKIGLNAVRDHISNEMEVFVVGFTLNEIGVLAQCSLGVLGNPEVIYRKIEGVSYSDSSSETDDADSDDHGEHRSEQTSISTQSSINWSINNGMDSEFSEEDKENRNRMSRRKQNDENHETKIIRKSLQKYDALSPMTPMEGTQSVTVSPSISCSDISSPSEQSNQLNHDLNHNRSGMNSVSFDSPIEDHFDEMEQEESTPKRRIEFGEESGNEQEEEDEEEEEILNQIPIEAVNTLRTSHDETIEWNPVFRTENNRIGGFGTIQREESFDVDTTDDPVPGVSSTENIQSLQLSQVENERRLFREELLCGLERDRGRTHSITFVFGLLFGIWFSLNVFWFTFYDIGSLCIYGAVIVLLLKGCASDGASFQMLLMMMISIKKGIELILEGFHSMQSGRGIDYDDQTLNEAVLYGLFVMMMYLLITRGYDGDGGRNCHWKAIQEDVYNRGKSKAICSFVLYFECSGFLAMDLVKDYSLSYTIGAAAFMCFAISVWIKLQNNAPSQISKGWIYGLCGCFAVQCAVWMVDRQTFKIKEFDFDEKRILLPMTLLFSLQNMYEI